MSTTGSRFAQGLSGGLRALEAIGQRRSYRSGTTIFRAGDAGDGFHLVESGRVRIEAGSGTEGGRVLATIAPGDFFGEMAVLDDAPRSASAIADADTVTVFLGREELLRLLQEQPRLALDLIRDVFARMRTTNQRYVEDLLQAERLATVGRLARSTVHDFKNPLAIISLAAELAGRADGSAKSRQQAQDMILKQVGRMNAMLHELIEFTRTGRTEFEPERVAVADFLAGVGADLTAELTERGVTLRIDPVSPDLQIAIDRQRLPRLLHNLIGNAVDAMSPVGGAITVTHEVRDGSIRIEINDTGPGIAPEIADRLFQPFATHGKAHGTGLGLSICRRIVEDHRGTIWARNRPGEGATFGFALPLV